MAIALKNVDRLDPAEKVRITETATSHRKALGIS